MTYYDSVKKYFQEKAEGYDLVDNQLFWVLSDELAKKILKDKVIPKLPSDGIRLLDAGAGTGRRSLFLKDLIGDTVDIKADLIDMSKEMLEVANKKIIDRKLDKDFSCKVGNIEELLDLKNEEYDIGLSFYNVLSFVEDYNKAIKEVGKKIKKGGMYVGIVANKHHSKYFSILTKRLEQLENVKNGKIQFNELMPSIWCFDPEELKKTFLNAGFSDVKVFGLLNYIYPGMEETYIKGQSNEKINILGDKKNFENILDIEYQNCYNEHISCRGNTLLFLATK